MFIVISCACTVAEAGQRYSTSQQLARCARSVPAVCARACTSRRAAPGRLAARASAPPGAPAGAPRACTRRPGGARGRSAARPGPRGLPPARPNTSCFKQVALREVSRVPAVERKTPSAAASPCASYCAFRRVIGCSGLISGLLAGVWTFPAPWGEGGMPLVLAAELAREGLRQIVHSLLANEEA